MLECHRAKSRCQWPVLLRAQDPHPSSFLSLSKRRFLKRNRAEGPVSLLAVSWGALSGPGDLPPSLPLPHPPQSQEREPSCVNLAAHALSLFISVELVPCKCLSDEMSGTLATPRFPEPSVPCTLISPGEGGPIRVTHPAAVLCTAGLVVWVGVSYSGHQGS